MDLGTDLERSREHIGAHRDNCRELIEIAPRQSAFLEGAIAVYDWLLGEAPAPWSELGPATHEAVVQAQNSANAAIYGAPGAPDVVSRKWAVGVEHACMWVRGITAEPPGGPLLSEEDD